MSPGGIIDATMYIMNCMIVRRGKIRLVEAVQRAGDTNAALALIQNGVEPELHELLGAEEAEAFDKSVLKHIVGAHIAKKILTKDDLYGALACFWLVFVSCLPAAIPFFIFSQPSFALRVSNFISIAALFYVGQKWAQYAGRNAWLWDRRWWRLDLRSLAWRLCLEVRRCARVQPSRLLPAWPCAIRCAEW
jgi:hypothetical protein